MDNADEHVRCLPQLFLVPHCLPYCHSYSICLHRYVLFLYCITGSVPCWVSIVVLCTFCMPHSCQLFLTICTYTLCVQEKHLVFCCYPHSVFLHSVFYPVQSFFCLYVALGSSFFRLPIELVCACLSLRLSKSKLQ